MRDDQPPVVVFEPEEMFRPMRNPIKRAYQWADDAPPGQILFRAACVTIFPMYAGVIIIGLLGMWLT